MNRPMPFNEGRPAGGSLTSSALALGPKVAAEQFANALRTGEMPANLKPVPPPKPPKPPKPFSPGKPGSTNRFTPKATDGTI